MSDPSLWYELTVYMAAEVKSHHKVKIYMPVRETKKYLNSVA